MKNVALQFMDGEELSGTMGEAHEVPQIDGFIYFVDSEGRRMYINKDVLSMIGME